jgi:hypothetical protein
MTDNDRRPDGPNAGILAIVALGLSIASALAYLAGSLATLTGFLAFGASVPLGIYGATVYSRLLRLGIRVPGPSIGFFGGTAASITLAASALLVWAQGQMAADAPAAVVRLASDAAFALGGVGFATGLGLLMAGIGVPALILRLTPRWLAWTGLVLAALGELSFFTLLVPGLAFMLPIVRFAGLAWLTSVGFLLPRNRHEVHEARPRS